jgi:hypothetical protein
LLARSEDIHSDILLKAALSVVSWVVRLRIVMSVPFYLPCKVLGELMALLITSMILAMAPAVPMIDIGSITSPANQGGEHVIEEMYSSFEGGGGDEVHYSSLKGCYYIFHNQFDQSP